MTSDRSDPLPDDRWHELLRRRASHPEAVADAYARRRRPGRILGPPRIPLPRRRGPPGPRGARRARRSRSAMADRRDLLRRLLVALAAPRRRRPARLARRGRGAAAARRAGGQGRDRVDEPRRPLRRQLDDGRPVHRLRRRRASPTAGSRAARCCSASTTPIRAPRRRSRAARTPSRTSRPEGSSRWWSRCRTRRDGDGVLALQRDAASLLRAVTVASALGTTSAYTWLKLPACDDPDVVFSAHDAALRGARRRPRSRPGARPRQLVAGAAAARGPRPRRRAGPALPARRGRGRRGRRRRPRLARRIRPRAGTRPRTGGRRPVTDIGIEPSSLLRPRGAAAGAATHEDVVLTPQDAGWTYCGLRVLRLAPGEPVDRRDRGERGLRAAARGLAAGRRRERDELRARRPALGLHLRHRLRLRGPGQHADPGERARGGGRPAERALRAAAAVGVRVRGRRAVRGARGGAGDPARPQLRRAGSVGPRRQARLRASSSRRRGTGRATRRTSTT